MPHYIPCISCGLYHDSIEGGFIEEPNTHATFHICLDCCDGLNGSKEEILKRIVSKVLGKTKHVKTLGEYLYKLPPLTLVTVQFRWNNSQDIYDELSLDNVFPIAVIEHYSESNPFPLSAAMENDEHTQIEISYSEKECTCTINIIDDLEWYEKRINR